MTRVRSTKRQRSADPPPGGVAVGFPPLTVSREALLRNRSDRAFRVLVDQLLTFGAELRKAREALAHALGVTPPQYRILMAIARHTGREAISISEVAEALGVSLPFVVKQTRLLMDSGRLVKRIDASDRRRVQLLLTRRSVQAITKLASVQVGVNDTLFGSLSRKDLETLSRLLSGLIASAQKLTL
jgi:MarR family transcriptional regulator, organic hydroperoxide resistance regulator